MEQDVVEFSTRRPHSVARVRQTGPATVEVTIALTAEGPAGTVTLTWAGASLDPVRLGERMAQLRSPVTTGDQSLVVRVGGQTHSLAWSAAQETPELKELRASLEQASHVPLAEATAFLERGRAHEEAKSLEAASESFQHGIDALAKLYRDPESLDDTGLKLTLAHAQLEKGDLESATALLEGVLDSRIALYRKAHLKASAPEGALHS